MSTKKKRTLAELCEDDDELEGAEKEDEPSFLYQLNQPTNGIGCPLCNGGSALLPHLELDLHLRVLMPEELTELFDRHITVIRNHWEGHGCVSNDFTRLNVALLIEEANRRNAKNTRLSARFEFQPHAGIIRNTVSPVELCGAAWKAGYSVKVTEPYEGALVADIEAVTGKRRFDEAIREKIERGKKLASLAAELPVREQALRVKQLLAKEADSGKNQVELFSRNKGSDAKSIPQTPGLSLLLTRSGIHCASGLASKCQHAAAAPCVESCGHSWTATVKKT